MKVFTKSLFACALVSLLSTSAQAVTWSGEGGWEVQYTGFVNLFYNQLEFETQAGETIEDSAVLNEGLLPTFHTMKAKSPTVNGLTGTSQITFAVDTSSDKHTNLNKGGATNLKTTAGDALIDLRETFFNVEGSFGTLSVGRTLALFQRQAILKDMTLFGVGALADPDSNGTALGRIGIGYVYPDFRARFAWASPTVNGFQASFGVFQPREAFDGVARSGRIDETREDFVRREVGPEGTDVDAYATRIVQYVDSTATITRVADTDPDTAGNQPEGDPALVARAFAQATMDRDAVDAKVVSTSTDNTLIETDMPMFQGELTWSGAMGEGINLGLWAGFIWQEADVIYRGIEEVVPASTQSVTTSGYNFGVDFTYGNANFVGSYYGGDGLGILFAQGGLNAPGTISIECVLDPNTAADAEFSHRARCGEVENSGGYIQGTYTIPGAGDSKTKVGASWGYSQRDEEQNLGLAKRTNEGYTVGVYHDINSWLKVIAEYNDYDLATLGPQVSGFSLGTFMFW